MYTEKLDYIPSGCVYISNAAYGKGRQYSACTVYDTDSSIAEMESETDSRPPQGQISMLQSQEMNSTAQYSFRTLDQSWHGMPHA